MGTFASLEDARAYFQNDVFAMNCGIQIDELTDAHCLCSMKITKNRLSAVQPAGLFHR